MIIKNCTHSCKEIVIILLSAVVVDLLAFYFLTAPVSPLVLAVLSVLKATLLLWYLLWSGHRIALALVQKTSLVLLAGISSLGLLFILNYLSSFLPASVELKIFIRSDSPSQSLAIIAMTIVSVFFEELLYRGFLFHEIKKTGLTTVSAVLFTSLLFSTGHIHLGLPGVVFSFVSSLLLTLLYNWGGSLLLPYFVHLLYNLSILGIHSYF